MNKQNQFDKKRKSKLQQQNDDDDEQIEKTLNFFDSILDQYLTDQDKREENHIQKSPQIKPTNGISTRQNGITSNHTNTSSSSSSSSPRYIPAPQFHQRFEQTSHVRRYISEKNLNESPSSSKPKIPHSRNLRTTATSTEDLTAIPSEKHHSNFIKKINQLSSNGASASLIDLSSIDKLSSRPRFRFVPPSNENHILKEEPEIEEKFHLKTISSDPTPFNHQTKSSHKIVKPTVITPSVPKSAPVNRLTETNIHYQNGNSAFKPHRSSQNGVSSKIQQIKRTESIHKTTNSDNDLLLRQQHSYQSVLNLPSPRPVHTNHFGHRTSYQSNIYHPSRPFIYEDPLLRWIQQANINGFVHPENRSQQQAYPYGSYITTNISSPMNNYREQKYLNPINVYTYYPPQYPPNPIQPVYIPPSPGRNVFLPPSSSSSNVYNFNQNNSPRDGQSKRNNQHRQNVMITTYL